MSQQDSRGHRKGSMGHRGVQGTGYGMQGACFMVQGAASSRVPCTIRCTIDTEHSTVYGTVWEGLLCRIIMVYLCLSLLESMYNYITSSSTTDQNTTTHCQYQCWLSLQYFGSLARDSLLVHVDQTLDALHGAVLDLQAGVELALAIDR